MVLPCAIRVGGPDPPGLPELVLSAGPNYRLGRQETLPGRIAAGVGEMAGEPQRSLQMSHLRALELSFAVPATPWCQAGAELLGGNGLFLGGDGLLGLFPKGVGCLVPLKALCPHPGRAVRC